MIVLAVAGPIAGVVYFTKELLTVRKTQLENRKLERELVNSLLTEQKTTLEIAKLRREASAASSASASETSEVPAASTSPPPSSSTAIVIASPSDIVLYGSPRRQDAERLHAMSLDLHIDESALTRLMRVDLLNTILLSRAKRRAQVMLALSGVSLCAAVYLLFLYFNR